MSTFVLKKFQLFQSFFRYPVTAVLSILASIILRLALPDKIHDIVHGRVDLFLIGNRRFTVALLFSVASKICMASAVNDRLLKIRWEFYAVLFVFLHVEDAVIGTIHGEHLKSAAAQRIKPSYPAGAFPTYAAAREPPIE